MALFDLISEPVRAPVRRKVQHYRGHFENLIHAIKNDIVDRIDSSDTLNDEFRRSVSAAQSTVTDQLAVNAASTRSLSTEIEAIRADLAAMREEQTPAARLRHLAGARLVEIDEAAAALLNWASAWNGPLSDVGLFINHPYLVEWRPGGAFVRLVNERIIEQPFVFGAIADLPVGSRLLDIGGGESTLALALASLGHDVTVIEPRGYPFEHPNLTVYSGPLQAFTADEPFDAVILLSTIEHLGIGHYADGTAQDASADLEAMKIVQELTAPGGKLVLTTPYGPSAVTELERVYDSDDLRILLDGWQVKRLTIGREENETTWTVESEGLVDHRGDKCVAMVVAELPDPGAASSSPASPAAEAAPASPPPQRP